MGEGAELCQFGRICVGGRLRSVLLGRGRKGSVDAKWVGGCHGAILPVWRAPKKSPAKAGLIQRSRAYLLARVPTTSISTRRFGCRHSISFLRSFMAGQSLTGCFSPLPSV